MAYASISKPKLHFNTLTWTGDGSGSRNITGVGFQPDWVWGKCRNTTVSHAVYDSVRGASKLINTNATSVEGTNAALSAFISDGFTVNSDSYLNGNSNTYVAWNWKAGGSGSANTDGNINSTVSVNTTAGFSIVTYTTSSSGTDTVGHGLGVKPDVLITKSRNQTYNWDILHHSINDNGSGRFVFADDAYITGSNPYANTTPTASVFSFNAGFYGASNNVTYCFAEKKGYSKFGTYIGNGSTDGPFVYTGFKPAMVIKKASSRTGSWQIEDNKRDTGNPCNLTLFPSSNSADESTSGVYDIDMLSNGFKLRATNTYSNDSGATYIYMAFAAEPLVANVGESIPATAR